MHAINKVLCQRTSVNKIACIANRYLVEMLIARKDKNYFKC